MKEVMAVIRINKINETKRALAAAGLPSVTATGRVFGRGKGLVDYKLLNGAQEGYVEAIDQLGVQPKLMPKRLLTLVVKDEYVDTAVKTLIKTNQTGNFGDGKIFVLPVADSYRVRTSERGDSTLD